MRREAIDALKSRLDAMCDGADDLLFDLSQKAPADEQSLYFDAMRELRVQRPALTGSFLAGVGDDFDLLEGRSPAARKPAGGLSLEGLTLLGEDELDVSVAFQSMVNRVRDALATDLDHLRQRCAKVLARETDVEKLPWHPARVCEHFRLATDALKVPVKARLIIFKLFERKVLDDLHDVVAHANQALAAAGVLPEIRSAKPRPVQSPTRERGAAAKPGGEAPAADDAAPVAAFAELLALARSAFAGGGGGGGGMAGLPGGGAPLPLAELPAGQLPVMVNGQPMVGGRVVQSDVPLVVVPRAELTALLTRLQQLQPPEPGRVFDHAELAGEALEDAKPVDVKAGLSNLMEEVPRALNGVDDDVINVVSMLFDFILGDDDLQPQMKALIGRLQIPLLKVALLDRQFFAEEDHPARRLLNALARAGIGWTQASDDGLFRQMEDVVYRVLNEFTDDVGLFTRLHDEFALFVAEREKRMTLIEARLRDREEGQARTEQAQQVVREAVAERIAGRSLPGEVVVMIQEAWQRVLYMTAVREGTDSEAWRQRLKVLEVMVWCAQHYDKPDLRERQQGLVPRLQVSLRKGFEATGFDAARGEELLAALNTRLAALAGGERVRAVRVVAEAVPDNVPRPAASGAEAVQVLRRTEDEVVIAAPAPPPPVSVQQVEERWLSVADNLPPGSWVEYQEQDFKVRGKIAARIRAQGKYVFVNGRGVKIFEKTIAQLAADLQAGVARLVNDNALFDRALENMIARLKTGQAVAG